MLHTLNNHSGNQPAGILLDDDQLCRNTNENGQENLSVRLQDLKPLALRSSGLSDRHLVFDVWP